AGRARAVGSSGGPPLSTLFPSTTLSRSEIDETRHEHRVVVAVPAEPMEQAPPGERVERGRRRPREHVRVRRREHRALERAARPRDRKSTRQNSSHVKISYAVFCLQKNNR